jgi:hypothetical protein
VSENEDLDRRAQLEVKDEWSYNCDERENKWKYLVQRPLEVLPLGKESER